MTVGDHRIRVAAQRREKTRLRLIEAALPVFAARGVDATVIDEVIGLAGVSRGTFYNYFRSNAELLLAVSEALSNEAVRCVNEAVERIPDPVERIAAGLRLFLDLADRYPLLGRFTHRAGLGVVGPGHMALSYLPRDIKAGVALGRFSVIDLPASVDLVLGAMLMAIHVMDVRSPPPSYPAAVIRHILMALGVAADEASALAGRPMAGLTFSPGSWLEQAHVRAGWFSEKSEVGAPTAL